MPRRCRRQCGRLTHDWHGTPLSTAPQLTVPPTVVNRTLASAAVGPVSPGAPTTNGAVAASHLGGPGSLVARFPRPIPIALGVGGAVIVAAIGVGVVFVSSRSKAPASSAPEVTTMAAARPEPSAPSAASTCRYCRHHRRQLQHRPLRPLSQ